MQARRLSQTIFILFSFSRVFSLHSHTGNYCMQARESYVVERRCLAAMRLANERRASTLSYTKVKGECPTLDVVLLTDSWLETLNTISEVAADCHVNVKSFPSHKAHIGRR